MTASLTSRSARGLSGWRPRCHPSSGPTQGTRMVTPTPAASREAAAASFLLRAAFVPEMAREVAPARVGCPTCM